MPVTKSSFILPLILLLSCSLLFAETDQEYKLWRITDGSGQNKGYLLGSGHLPISFPRFTKVFPEMYKIFSEVTDVAVENCLFDNTINNCSELEEELMSIVFNCEKGLGSLLNEREMEHARKKLMAAHGEDSLIVENADCLLPMVALDNGFQSVDDFMLDKEIADYAQWYGKEVHALEQFEYIEGVSHLPPSVQREALRNWLKETKYHTAVMNFDEVKNLMSRAVHCYLEGDLCQLLEFEKELYALLEMSPNLQDSSGVLEQRNHCWLPSMLKLLSQEEKKTLFVVGLKHIYGSDNLVRLLQSEGYKVEPVALKPRVLSFSESAALITEEVIWADFRVIKQYAIPHLLPPLILINHLRGVVWFLLDVEMNWKNRETGKNGTLHYH